MAFSYGSDALNELAQGVAREPADLSTKADVSALATTNATVATKLTLGEPVKTNARTVTIDTTVDPDIPFWILDASASPVTLTLPPVGNVVGRQFVVFCSDATNVTHVRADPATADLLIIGDFADSVISWPKGYCVTLLAYQASGLALWLGIAVVDNRAPVYSLVSNTTLANTIETLPPLTEARGVLFCYKNTGTAGHTLTVNPAGTDTINGSATGVVLADGASTRLAQERGALTNWLTV